MLGTTHGLYGSGSGGITAALGGLVFGLGGLELGLPGGGTAGAIRAQLAARNVVAGAELASGIARISSLLHQK